MSEVLYSAAKWNRDAAERAQWEGKPELAKRFEEQAKLLFARAEKARSDGV
jgi:hypothetical protein